MRSPRQWIAVVNSTLSRFLQRVGPALRLRGPLAENATAQILHTLLLGFAAWLIFHVVVLPTTARPFAAAIMITCTGLVVSGALVLLYRGSLRAASLAYLGGTWLSATVLISLNGGIRTVEAAYYVAVPISAAWLLGYRAALASAALCLACF